MYFFELQNHGLVQQPAGGESVEAQQLRVHQIGPPVQNQVRQMRPVAGECITPWPLKPFARKNPGTSLTGPITG